LNSANTTISSFHLNNFPANCIVNVELNGQELQFELNPTYLGVKLDRTLTYKRVIYKNPRQRDGKECPYLITWCTTTVTMYSSYWYSLGKQPKTSLQHQRLCLLLSRSRSYNAKKLDTPLNQAYPGGNSQ